MILKTERGEAESAEIAELVMHEEWTRSGPGNTTKLTAIPDEWNALTERIIGAAIEVHRHLGPGLPERHYEEAMEHELRIRGLRVARQVPCRVKYKDLELSECRLDLIVEGIVVLEIKAVDRVHEVALAQLVSYLRVFDMPVGLLINFHSNRVTDAIYRRINTKAIPGGLAQRGTPCPSAASAPSASPRSA